MWVKVRSMDGSGKIVSIGDLSRVTKIADLKEKLVVEFDASPEHQRLFFRGKQLANPNTLFDYGVGLNDLIQIVIVRDEEDGESGCETGASPKESSTKESASSSPKKRPRAETAGNINGNSADFAHLMPEENGFCYEIVEKDLYKVGDWLEARNLMTGAWYEAQVVKIFRRIENEDDENCESADGRRKRKKKELKKNDDVIYFVQYDKYDDSGIFKVTLKDLHPKCKTILQWNQLASGQRVMVNYNPDRPKELGDWYEAEITKKVENKDYRELHCRLILGDNTIVKEECQISALGCIYKIEPNPGLDTIYDGSKGPNRRVPDCRHCMDDPSSQCRYCGCDKCGEKTDPDKQLLCDECDDAYHIYCLDPPLDEVPDTDEWFCPGCRNDSSKVVNPGQSVETRKVKSKRTTPTNRDWGRGMACVGRSKVCTIVPPNHFGAIPEIPVGSQWKFRVQASECGIHRPHVAGMHGRDGEGVFSIVLAGGYEDDLDEGETFTYTGSGGRDLSGNRRTASQSCDQTLTKTNRALALNCNAPLNDEGAEAKDWENGKPVRVIRSYKLLKTSKYAPKEGIRYDGTYKVVKYWSEKGKSGFLVWRYLLRRDDPSPAPWTREGQKEIQKAGIKIKYPDGYLDSQKRKTSSPGSSKARSRKRKGSPRKLNHDGDGLEESAAKKAVVLTSEQIELIKADKLNEKLWDELLSNMDDGQLLERIQEQLTCVCCQEIVWEPITTECAHNICKECLKRSFKANVHSCSVCRRGLGVNYKAKVNEQLSAALHALFPSYGIGR
ncbi:E3 ubiquitin-protein ligase UHRF1-like [Oscarella lobularis]|uniref:E3 ubiquitin-protein ligase UHRF1-like n=1 Tax=Oscarella lobularis TaxID=121494 RepID=UPI0033137BF4